MATESTVLAGSRRTLSQHPRYPVIGAVVLAIALTVVISMVGRELESVESRAGDVRDVVLPQIIARQQRAIWIESLRSAANVVLYAPDRTTRRQALAKAEQLAANVTHVDAASRAALDDAWQSIRLAAGKADEAEQVGRQVQTMLTGGNRLIADMSASVSAIVDNSGAAIARIVREATGAQREAPRAKGLNGVMAINTASHDLLASLDRGRTILNSAPSLESDRELDSARRDFVAIANQLQAQIDSLLGDADDPRLPEKIERFRRLEPLFDLQRRKLELRQQALQASASAKLRLGVVRETLAADAAVAADASVAAIAASASRIKLSAAAMVVILLVAAVIPLVRNGQAGRAAAEVAARASPTEDAGHALPVDPDAMRATVDALESLVTAQGNLEHWRMTLAARLTGTVASALLRVAEHARGVSADPRSGPREPASGDDRDTADDLVPSGLAPCLTRVCATIEDVAVQTSLAGLKASLDGVRLIAGAGPDPDETAPANPPLSPSEALLAACAVAEAVSERVGTAVSEINAVAQKPDRDLARVRADIVRMVVQLADQLAAIRDGNCRRRGYAG